MNPYKELGVSENATSEEIRAAYLKMVKQYHPDVCGNLKATKIMQSIMDERADILEKLGSK